MKKEQMKKEAETKNDSEKPVEETCTENTTETGVDDVIVEDAIKHTPEEEKLMALEAENKALHQEMEDVKNGFLRKMAEFDNIKKRLEREKDEFLKYASEKLVLKVLEVHDNLERAIDSSKQTQDFEALVKGVEMISTQFEKVLTEEGVVAIECIGQSFDPYKHHAMMSEESEEKEDTIIMELQKGYEMKGKVIRPSLVKVSK